MPPFQHLSFQKSSIQGLALGYNSWKINLKKLSLLEYSKTWLFKFNTDICENYPVFIKTSKDLLLKTISPTTRLFF